MIAMYLSEHSRTIVDFLSSLVIELPDISSAQTNILREQYLRYRDVFEDVQKAPIVSSRLTKQSMTNDTTFMSDEIGESCSSMSNTFSICKKYGTRSVTVLLKTDRDMPDDQLPFAVSQLMTISHMFGTLKHLVVNYCAACQLKSRPAPGVTLDPSHVNTGATLAVGHGEIDVWRQEEFVKVLVHESIHSLRLDIKDIPEEQLLMFYRFLRIDSSGCRLTLREAVSPVACNTKIYPNEAWTEMMADIFNVFYVSTILNKDHLELLHIERKWSLFQAAKILDLNGFDTIESFSRESDDGSTANELKQKTNVFSYYILRAGMMFNIDTFLQFIADSSVFIRFTKHVNWSRDDQPRLDRFLNMCILNLYDTGFISCINDLIHVIKTRKVAPFVTETMRLTAISLST